ncbi:MAG: CTP-dependent riboflavin kinase [Deltaproteobacteria bacterium]|nr:CTP-dependent riboflavin kinase [Deltaproteobacteria bacterium]
MGEIRGVIERGAGKGAYFMGVDWVREQCRRMLGYEPYPGTLNVRVLDEDAERLDSFLRDPEFELVPDDPAFCSARVKKVTVNGIPAAVVLPAEEVRIHGERVIEILAASSLKASLGLADGDMVTVAASPRIDPEGPEHSFGRSMMDLYREIFDFASSAGALEGYVYPGETRDLMYLDDWIGNLVKQYGALPEEVRARIQDGVDRTIGRAALSLEPVLGKDHPHVHALLSLVRGSLPASPDDFEQEKREKAERYGER